MGGVEETRKLALTYNEFQNGEVKISKLLEAASDPAVLHFARMLINKESINPEIPYTAQEIDFIHEFIKVCQYIYEETSFEPPISDTDYDILYAIIFANSETEEFAQPIYHTKTNIVHHKYPTLRGTLKKVYYLTNDEPRIGKSRQSLDEWIASREKMLSDRSGVKVNLKKEKTYIFPKWDGVSAVLEIDENNQLVRALTRGDTSRNEACDITAKLKYIPIHQHLAHWEYGLKVEVVMTEENKDRFNLTYGTNYKNSRSIVSAILMSDEVDPDKIAYLEFRELRVQDFSPLEYLADDVLRKDPYIVSNIMNREKIRKFANEHRFVKGVRCDGIVIQFANPNVQSALGRDNDINNFEVAYKFTEEVARSHVRGVQFQVGLFGTITPVVVFDGRRMKGNMVTSASVGSIGRFKDLHLHKNDELRVHYDIVPYITKEPGDYEGTELIPLPTRCPVCDAELEYTDSEAFCSNEECPSRKIGRFVNYITKMGIKGISFQRIRRMMDAGILRDLPDLYHLKDFRTQICEIRGLGPMVMEQMMQAIDERRTVTSSRFMGAIGITGCSINTFDKIFRVYTLKELLKMSEKEMASALKSVSGIGDSMAKTASSVIIKKMDLIKALMKELTIIDPPKFNPKWVVCFHNVRDPELEMKISDEMGGKVVRSITNDTKYLVVPNGEQPEDSKIRNALDKGVTVIGIDDFRKEIEK